MLYTYGMNTTTLEKKWIPDTAQFGARLALVRWKMRWNLKEASLECGLTQNSWQNWEEGAQPRNYMDAVDRIVKRTQVSRMWLMMGEGKPSDYKAPVSHALIVRKTRPKNRTGSTGPKNRR